MTKKRCARCSGARTRSRISSRPSSAAAGGPGEARGRARRRARRPTRARAGRDIEQELELGLEDAYNGTMRRSRSSTTARRAPSTCAFRPASATARASASPAKASTGTGGAQSGDLYLRIRLAPHPQFERKGRDLYTRVPVPLTTAVLGGEAEVKTLGGKSLRLKIPPTTQNGQVFRLKGHGMPVTGKPDEHGDLYATVDVQLPSS